MKRMVSGMACAIVSACLYGLCAVFTKLFTTSAVSIAAMLTLRGAAGAILLLLINALRKKRVWLPGRKLGRAMLLGLAGNGATLLLLNLAYGDLSVGTATTIHYLYPAIVCVISAVCFREKLRLSTWVCLGACMGSMALFLEQTQGASATGIGLALLSAAAWTFQLIYLERSGLLEEDAVSVAFVICCMICLLGVLYGLATGTLALRAAMPQLPGIVLTALCNHVLAMLFLNQGVARIGAGMTSVLSVFEPVSSIVFGAVILRERLSVRQTVAAAAILVSITALILTNMKSKRPAPETGK